MDRKLTLMLAFAAVGSFLTFICVYLLYIWLYRCSIRFNGWTTATEALNNTDLSNKVVLITGANSGIGFETARVLYNANATVIMACRNVQKAEKAKQLILKQYHSNNNNNNNNKSNPNRMSLNNLKDNDDSGSNKSNENKERLFIIETDLSSLKSISEISRNLQFIGKNLETKIKKTETETEIETPFFIDFIINNAGIMALPKYQETKDGYEMQFGTNHLGHFYFTLLVLEYNKNVIKNKNQNNNNNNDNTSERKVCRIINLSSFAHYAVPVTDFGKRFLETYNKLEIGPRKERYHKWFNYATSKACNILFSRGLHYKYNENMNNNNNNVNKLGYNVESVSVHPGTILTNLGREMPIAMRMASIFSIFLKLFFLKTVEQGAATTVRCVVLKSKSLMHGGYYDSCKPAIIRYGIKKDDYSNALLLWQYSIKLIQKKGFKIPNLQHT